MRYIVPAFELAGLAAGLVALAKVHLDASAFLTLLILTVAVVALVFGWRPPLLRSRGKTLLIVLVCIGAIGVIAPKEKLLSCGAYPAVSLVQARTRRDDARALLAEGKDPGQAKQEQKALKRDASARTFTKLADELLAKMEKEGKAENTLSKIDWLLRLAKADFGKMPIGEITPPVVLKCLRKVEAKGNYESAKRLRATIGGVFRYAIANGAAENDPTYALQGALIRPTVKPRAAITDPVQLGGLLRAIDAFNGQAVTRLGLQLMALLVPRPGELRAARWSEFDLDGAVWSIPAERMKMRRDHRTPLRSRRTLG